MLSPQSFGQMVRNSILRRLGREPGLWHVTRGQIHRRRTLFGEIGFPDTVEKIRSSAAVRFA